MTSDRRARRRGKIKTYQRLRWFRSLTNDSKLLIAYQPIPPWLRPWYITVFADDRLGIQRSDVQGLLDHCRRYTLSTIELSFDFHVATGVDEKFVRRHGRFGKSCRRNEACQEGYLQFGSHTSSKLVRCYGKRSISRYRVELELHSQLLRKFLISRVGHLDAVGVNIHPDHICFFRVDWTRLEASLRRKFGLRSQAIIEKARSRARTSLRRFQRFLVGKEIPNPQRFLKPMKINEEVELALQRWLIDFQGAAN